MFRQTLLATVLVSMAATPAFAQQAPHKAPPAKHPVKAVPVKPAKEEGVASAVTVGLRAGYNKPSSQLSAGFVPDVDLGYRIGLGAIGLEPAIGWQRWSGNRTVTVSSPELGASESVKQSATAQVFEGRARLWYDLKDAGYPILGLGVGGVSEAAQQKSFGETRDEKNGALTWTVQIGYAYPIEPAYGNVELLLGYRSANVDIASTGKANLSGFQVLLGWHAAFTSK